MHPTDLVRDTSLLCQRLISDMKRWGPGELPQFPRLLFASPNLLLAYILKIINKADIQRDL